MKFTCNNVQGAYAESVFITECIARKVNTYRPVLDNHGVDFVIKTDKFYQLQIKSSSNADERYSTRNSFKVSVVRGYNKRMYGKDDFDFCCIYIIPFDTWYIIPIDEIKTKCIRVTIDSDKCKFNPYKEAWHLLQQH